MAFQEALDSLLEQQNLSSPLMQKAMQAIMTGSCDDAQIAGFLVALRIKGETVDEIASAAQVMASLSSEVHIKDNNVIDIVGTGGDGTSTFNVSTAAAFVAAGAGCTVAKHGNRSVSSKSGSADLLEAAGAKLDLSADQVAEVIARAGVGFMFAPMHHSAMRHAIGARKSLSARTIFNILGPLTNPARVRRQVVGVYKPVLTETLANVFAQLGSVHTLVVHSEDGMDEISNCAATKVSELKDGGVNTYKIEPEQFGLRRADVSELVVASPSQSLAKIDSILKAEKSAARDIVVLNAAAGIYVAGVAQTLEEGVQLAQQALDSGKALAAQRAYIDATQSIAPANIGANK